MRVILREGGNANNKADYVAQNVNSFSTKDKTNTNLQTDLRTPQERRAVFVDGIYDLTDNVRLRTNMLYSFRDSNRHAVRACVPRWRPRQNHGPAHLHARLQPQRSAPGCWSGTRCRR